VGHSRHPAEEGQIAARKRKGPAGGRPPALDTETYKRRNVVERTFALTKQWRALATRYDKLAITYRAAVLLAACITWSRVQETRPSRRRGAAAWWRSLDWTFTTLQSSLNSGPLPCS
jgi:hypothetical protein